MGKSTKTVDEMTPLENEYDAGRLENELTMRKVRLRVSKDAKGWRVTLCDASGRALTVRSKYDPRLDYHDILGDALLEAFTLWDRMLPPAF